MVDRSLCVQVERGHIVAEATLTYGHVGPWTCHLELVLEEGRSLSADATDFFECLAQVRLQLEPEGARILCQGARRDVWPSGMARDMGAGLRAYVLVPGRKANFSDLVDIFDPADPALICTVAEQSQFSRDWSGAADLTADDAGDGEHMDADAGRNYQTVRDEEHVRAMSVEELVARRLDESDPWRLALVQRHAVWDEVRTARLLDSLLAGYPIGSLLVCRVKRSSHVLVEKGDTRIAERAQAGTWQLLDGQQRVNALVAIFTGLGGFGRFLLDLTVRREPEDVVTRRRAKRAATRHIVWLPDEDTRSQDAIDNRDRYLDLSRWGAWASPDRLGHLRLALNATASDGTPLISRLNEIDPEFADDLDPKTLQTVADNLRRVLRIWCEPTIPVQHLTLDGPNDVLQVFSRINLEGVRLDGEDVFFAAVKTMWNDAEENLDRVTAATGVLNRLTALRLLARLASRAVRDEDLLPLRVDALNGAKGERIIRALRRLAADGSEPLGRIGLLGRLLTTEPGLGYALHELDKSLLDHVFGWVAVHPRGTDQSYLREQLPSINAYLLGAASFRYPAVFRDTFARAGFSQAVEAGAAGCGFPIGAVLAEVRAKSPELKSGQRVVRSNSDEAGHIALADANPALFLSVAQRLPYDPPLRDGGPSRRAVEWDHIYPQALAKNMRVPGSSGYPVNHPHRHYIWSAGNLWALDRPINNRASDDPPSKKFGLLDRLPDSATGLPSPWPVTEDSFLTDSERALVLDAEAAIDRKEVAEGMVSFRSFARGRALRLYEAVAAQYPAALLFAAGAPLQGADQLASDSIPGNGVRPSVSAALGLEELVKEEVADISAADAIDEPEPFDGVLKLARQRGLEEELRRIIDVSRALGLHPHPYKTSLMVAPPSHHGRMLFTVWPQAGGTFTIYRLAATVAQFFPWLEVDTARRLGPDGYGELPAEEVDPFLGRLRALFASHDAVLHSAAMAPVLSGREIADAALAHLRAEDPDRRGLHYYDITHAVEHVGPVGGKNPVGTVLGVLSGRGDRFMRVAPGTYTWLVPSQTVAHKDASRL